MVYSHYVHVKYIKKGGPTRNYTQTVGTQKSEVIIRNNNNRNNVIGNSILNNGQKKPLPYLQVHKIRKPLYFYTTLQSTIAKSGYLIR